MADAYDWNKQCRYFNIEPLEVCDKKSKTSNQSFVNTIRFEGDPPSSEKDISTFISENDLEHGDLVNFGDYRQVDVYIIQRNEEGEMSWIKNPDDPGAGYLTIPACITKSVSDVMAKFKELINFISDQGEIINIHTPSSDPFIKQKLGDSREGFDFDILFEGLDNIDGFSVKKLDTGEQKSFDWGTVTWEDIIEKFEPVEGGISAFNIKVMLLDEDLEKYKSMHTKAGGSKQAWRQAAPKLPKGWEIEKGQAIAGAKKAGWVWKLSGPADTEDQMKANINKHFGDITFDTVDVSDTNVLP